jgi:basic amino acid/polyamine antiporter, APA family
MTDRVQDPKQLPGPAGEPAEVERPQSGLSAAMALIVGSIIGVGIFNLPTSLASYGPITLVSMG